MVALRGEWTFFFTIVSVPSLVFTMVVSRYCVVSDNTGILSVGAGGTVSRTTLKVSGMGTCAISAW